MRHFSDDEDYSAQLNDKSTQIWTGAAKKRQKAMQSLTPYYSRSQHIDNQINQSLSGIIDKQLDSIKQKLSHQRSFSQQKDTEIQNLKQRIHQLTKDKKILLSQIEYIHSQAHQNDQSAHQNTLNFEKTHPNQFLKASKNTKGNKYQLGESISQTCKQRLQDLTQDKLLQLLRSTSQYRSFADYHDSYKLIFLRQLHDSSKRNIKDQVPKKQEWSDFQIMNQLAKLNERQKFGLNYHNQSIIVLRLKEYYDRFYQYKAKDLRTEHEIKMKKTIKQASIIPQNLRQICKIKQGQLAQQMTRKKMQSLKKKQQY